jgi:ABC-type transport system involved in cytochrome c biogenesis ATPase subunit
VSGRAGTLVLTGEAGIGKTRLLRELGALATTAQVELLCGAATERESAPATATRRCVVVFGSWSAEDAAEGSARHR